MRHREIEDRASAIFALIQRSGKPRILIYIGNKGFRTLDTMDPRVREHQVVGVYDERCCVGWLIEDMTYASKHAWHQ